MLKILRLNISTSEKYFRRMMSDEVLFEKRNEIGSILLNRQKQLNALNLNMVKMINKQLDEWEKDNRVKAVIIKGAGDTAFCAGGDVKTVRDLCLKGEQHKALEFFREEYRLNNKIATYKKPYIALISGITMGGGVGLSVHGRYRIATEKSLFAMPETAIGFFADVGGSYFMPRLKGNIGLYLVLTGTRLKAQDVKRTGIATHFVSSNRLEDLENRLGALGDLNAKKVDDFLARWDEKVEDEYDTHHIAKIFNESSLEKIITNLENDDTEWSKQQLKLLSKMSPTSLKVSIRQLQLGLNKSLKECLEMEYQLCLRFTARNDFMEGVRALLIDRDAKPKWQPDSFNLVSEKDLDWYFNPLPEDEKLIL